MLYHANMKYANMRLTFLIIKILTLTEVTFLANPPVICRQKIVTYKTRTQHENLAKIKASIIYSNYKT